MTLTTVNAPDFLDPAMFFPRSAIPSFFIPQCFWKEGLSLHNAAERVIDHILDQLVKSSVYLREEKRWDLDALWVLVGCGFRGSHEKLVAELFNMVVSTALSFCGQSYSPYIWRSSESHPAESLRKPDVVLVPTQSTAVNFRHFQTFCEVRESDNPQFVDNAKAQITEMANIVGSIQVNRRFFVGSYLCGPLLHIALHARGCTLFSPSGLDISERPHDFIAIILHLSAASGNPAWNGFDSTIQDSGGSPLTLDWRHSSNCKRIRLTHPLHTSLCLRGSSTRVWVCDVLTQDEHDKGPAWKTCILKDCWMDQGFPADIQIHELLNSRTPKAFPDVTHEEVFGPKDAFNVFKDCVQVDGHWDHASHLRGIPLVRASVVPTCDTPTLDSEGQVVMKKLPDTTANILKRFFKGSAEWAEDSHQIRPFGRQRAWESTSDSTSVSASASASVSASTPASASAASSSTIPTTSMAETTSRPTRCTFPLQLRCPVNRHTSFPGVPIWATPGLHTVTEADVYSWKQAIPPTQFFPSIDPYWTSGTGGAQFVEGMTQLREYFAWTVEYDVKVGRLVPRPPKKPITHLEFLVLLKAMRDGWGDEDAPTLQDTDRARAEYKKVVRNSSFEHRILGSFGSKAYLSVGASKRSSSKRQRDEEGRSVSPVANRQEKILRRL
ncbi:hypothetical protein J3R83DRAFT_7477 [Lanmaoa asiatica]|nr:hypothetical protein J3R83DRAFT_7477 [Lanmaoa asiatica]